MKFAIFVMTNSGKRSYIQNIEPYIYTDDISKAKIFPTRHMAEYYLYRNYAMYHHLKQLIHSGAIKSVWLLELRQDLVEINSVRMV